MKTKPLRYTPLLYPLIGLVSGIWLSTQWLPAWWLLLCGTVAASVGIGYGLQRHKRQWLIVGISSLLFLVGNSLLSLQRYHAQQIHMALSAAPMNITARVTDKEDWVVDKKQSLYLQIIDSNALLINAYYFPLQLLCYLPSKTTLAVGDTVRLEGVQIKRQQLPQSPTGSYQDYLMKEGIIGSIFLKKSALCQLVCHPATSLDRGVWTLRNSMYCGIRSLLQSITKDYYGLIFLGNKQQRHRNDLQTSFNYWGLAHYLARSGLHISLFIILWSFLLRFLPLPLLVKRLLLVFLCAVYGMLSWSSIPFARSLYVFLFIKLGEFFYQQTNYLHLLTLLCMAMLLFNPMYLFFLDFQLTFFLTFTLLICSPLCSGK